MEPEKLPAIVREWIAKIEENVAVNPDLLMEYCDKLEQYATDTDSDHLKGYSLFFRGYGYYAHNRLEESMDLLSSALKLLSAADDHFMVARAYNAMGNIADFQGDLSLAIDCYCKGLALSKAHRLDLLTYSISSNISNIHISLGQHALALETLLTCEKLTEGGLSVPTRSRFVICSNLTICCIRLGKMEDAQQYLHRLISNFRENETEISRFMLCIVNTEFYHALGDVEKRDAAIAELAAMQLHATTVFAALNELFRHANLLLDLGKFEEFLALLDLIEPFRDNPNAEITMLDLRLKYYRKIGDTLNGAKTAIRYYEAVEQREDTRNKVVSHNILARMQLDEESARRKETERTNLMLKQKSERDPLTGMNNRYKLNEISELAFHTAHVNGTPLTVEILDIDCYKEFNDNYGHQAGDECLCRIADTIRTMEEYPNVHTARYGGDEFVIIYEDYTFSDIEKMARILQNRIHALNIEHKYSTVSDRVTISQGLFHRIPAGNNKPWDFLYCADMALYGVKRRSRNGYYIGTSLGEVRRYSENAKDGVR